MRSCLIRTAPTKLVDRLLAAPEYGERMAVPWLDLARFADSDGYHADVPRSMWQYRDWVIRAFNRNQPFDQFVVEQLAGDLPAERDARPAHCHRLQPKRHVQHRGRRTPTST